jgi:hypothetical protein
VIASSVRPISKRAQHSKRLNCSVAFNELAGDLLGRFLIIA